MAKQLGVTCLVLAMAMGSLGVSYARWTQNLHVVADLTTAPAPAVTTDGASIVTPNGATLNGTLTSLGTADSVDMFFEYGPNTGYGTEVPGAPSPLGTVPSSFSSVIIGLVPDTLYHFRAKAVGLFTAYGDDRQFRTLPENVTGFTAITPGAISPTPSAGTTIEVTGAGTITMIATINVNDNGHDYTFPITCMIWNSSGATKWVDTVTITANSPVEFTGITGALVVPPHTQIDNGTGVDAGISFVVPKGNQGGPYTATVTIALTGTQP